MRLPAARALSKESVRVQDGDGVAVRALASDAAHVLEKHFPGEVAGVLVLDSGRRAERALLSLLGASAVTIGRRVIARPGALLPANPGWLELTAHELVHVRQYRELGFVRFLLRYGWAYLRARLRGLDHKSAYHANPFEVEAREIAARVRQDDHGLT